MNCHQLSKEVEFRPLTSQIKNVLPIKLGVNEAMSRRKTETSSLISRVDYYFKKKKKFHSFVLQMSETTNYLRTETTMLPFFSYSLEQCNS